MSAESIGRIPASLQQIVVVVASRTIPMPGRRIGRLIIVTLAELLTILSSAIRSQRRDGANRDQTE